MGSVLYLIVCGRWRLVGDDALPCVAQHDRPKADMVSLKKFGVLIFDFTTVAA